VEEPSTASIAALKRTSLDVAFGPMLSKKA